MTHTNPALRLAIGVVAFIAIPPALFARNLTIAERVEYQRAIEQVYWNHRTWPSVNPAPKPPLSAVMPDTTLRAKVEDDLEKSNALERYWQRPVTAGQLQAEMDRMARDTRDPAMLRELFRALGDDPQVIAETLARQTLVDRLIHNLYANDARFHGDLKAKAEAARASCASIGCMKSMGGLYRQTRWQLRTEEMIADEQEKNVEAATLDASEWNDLIRKLATEFSATAESLPTNRLSGVEETRDAYVVTAILDQHDGEIATATVVWPKRSFESWWETVAPGVGWAIQPSSGSFTTSAVPSTTCTNDSWSTTIMQQPDPRAGHTAVWTGTEMIVWGGYYGDAPTSTFLNNGGRYNPSIDTWAFTATPEVAPAARAHHSAVWTGTEMIVWGGSDSTTYFNTGGRYNPSTNTWTATSNLGAPTGRAGHSAVWTGTEMIVWGGSFGSPPSTFLNTGSRYNPATDGWTATSASGAPAARQYHTAVWTGTEMIVWGGYNGGYFNTGGRYDPSSDTWTATSTGANVPFNRFRHTAVWTGTEMIVWGGTYTDLTNHFLNTGGRYDPSTDTWIATSQNGSVPQGRYLHTAVWTGTEMIVWGGYNGNYVITGGRYNPSTDTWTATSTVGTPTARAAHTAVWTGTEMIVWGGSYGFSPPSTFFNTGGRYNPSSNTWAATSTVGAPAARASHSAVWTGTEMVVWGGFSYTNTGGRYNPSTDTWAATSTGAGVPVGRYVHTTVWTGTEMIVWGGTNGSTKLNTGGRYNPLTDTWTATSTGASVPEGRQQHTAVWTGTEMIVWGGTNGTTKVNTGGRYNPSTDTWTATSTGANVPLARFGHSAVWSGTVMIVWGGDGNSIYELNTGGRYNPSTDTWAATSTGANVPAGRYSHTALWTGSEMIVWGGLSSGVYLNTGGRYNPSTDTWSATSTGANLPGGRVSHTASWTGNEMIAWGGRDSAGDLNTGGRYNPSTNKWFATSTGASVPAPRDSHTAVWTGKEMIIWGGYPYTSTGAVYCACPSGALAYRDADGDGHGDRSVSVATCDGTLPAGYVADNNDCNDAAATVWSVPGEVLDLGFASETSLGWTIPAQPGGTAPLYDVVRGALGAFPVGPGGGDEVCFDDQAGPTLGEPASPDPGTGFWYLARGHTSCGTGTFGAQSNGSPRATTTCP